MSSSMAAENRALLAMVYARGEGQEQWKQEHISLLMQRTRGLVQSTLHRAHRFRDAAARREEQEFLTRYLVEWGFSELFHPQMRGQRLLRGVPQERREKAKSLGLFYLVAERHLAEQTPRAERAASKEQRQQDALLLAARWREFAQAPSSDDLVSLPDDVRLGEILLRLWWFRIRETHKAWERGQRPRDLPMEAPEDVSSQAHAFDAGAPIGGAGQETSDTVAAAAEWQRISRLVPLVTRDAVDELIWQRKSDAITEKHIAEQLNQGTSDAAVQPSASGWTRAKVAGRWNALARRLRAGFLVIDLHAETPSKPSSRRQLDESWEAVVALPEATKQLRGLPLFVRTLFGALDKPKNPHLLWVPLCFWLGGQRLGELHLRPDAPGWDHVVQYWLMSQQAMLSDDEGATVVALRWTDLHQLY